MKRLALLAFVAVGLLTGCGGLIGSKEGKDGEQTGVMKRPLWDNPTPFGMLNIPPGSYHMGQNDQDVNYSQIAHNRQVTVSAFYMDETEIENNEYRQFVKNVKNETEFAFIDSTIEWLGSYYKKEIASTDEYIKLIYPDTFVWLRDYTFAYNEPLTENYWWHPAFDAYPVVGVNWYAAQAFCYWRTMLYNKNRTEEVKRPTIPRFRLPTEAEWEYSARGGFEHKIYPWEGPYIKNSRGCLFANYKPGRGDYIADNYEYTCPVKSYWPNDYGLYCMAGNVSEWCEDDFEESGFEYAHDLNPIYRDPTRKNTRRVVRGGSWKDMSYYLSVGSRDYEYADTAKAFIGFRTVVSELGRTGPNDL